MPTAKRRTKSSYDVHPGLAMVQKTIAGLKQKTGRTLDEIEAKSTKVWNSNRSVDENVKALKAPAKKIAAKKKTRARHRANA